MFVGLPAVCLVFARRFTGCGERRWAVYSVVTSIGFAVAFVLTSIGFSQAASLVGFGGLLQRVTLTVGWAWLTLLGAPGS